jgi:hypothetical protein
MPTLLEFGAQFREIVNLAVENDPNGSVFVKNRLVAARQVDDAQAPHSKAGSALDENPLVIRSPMDNRLAHVVDRAGFDPFAARRAHNASNPAHIRNPFTLRSNFVSLLKDH